MDLKGRPSGGELARGVARRALGRRLLDGHGSEPSARVVVRSGVARALAACRRAAAWASTRATVSASSQMLASARGGRVSPETRAMAAWLAFSDQFQSR